jgi:hypothetical protein
MLKDTVRVKISSVLSRFEIRSGVIVIDDKPHRVFEDTEVFEKRTIWVSGALPYESTNGYQLQFKGNERKKGIRVSPS